LNQVLRGQDHYEWHSKEHVWYCVGGTAVYLALSAILAYGCLYLGSVDTHSEIVRSFYFRGQGVYDTTYISLAKLVYYWLMNVAGYTFVNIVTLQNERKNPFHDAHENCKSFYKMAFGLVPFLFLISTNVTLKG